MVELYRANARVKALADTWIATAEGQAAKKKYAKDYSDPSQQTAALNSHAADEALARIAEELKTGAKVGTGQRAFVKTIAEWLAKVAEAIGMRNVAQSIRSETYTQVEKFVQQAMSAAVSAGPVNTEVAHEVQCAALTQKICCWWMLFKQISLSNTKSRQKKGS